ncbi:MAG TPA: PEP-CTERM sorting domain-containing protein [Vicinamibacterales bacterium]
MAPAVADPITVVSSSRFVQAAASATCCGLTNIAQNNLDSMAQTAVPPLEPNPSAVGSATQMSRIMEAERFFYGQGSVSGQVTAPGAYGTGQSYYRLTLDLSQPQNYVFIGVFESSRLNDGDTTSWQASITDDNAPDTPIFSLRDSDSIDRYQPGTLQPGRYDFLISMAAISTLPGGAANGVEDFRLEFSDVPPALTPEPASLLLLGSGAAFLFARRRTAATQSGVKPAS